MKITTNPLMERRRAALRRNDAEPRLTLTQALAVVAIVDAKPSHDDRYCRSQRDACRLIADELRRAANREAT